MEKTAPSKDWIAIQRMLLSGSSPYVTAKSWAVADGSTGELLFGRWESERREIASLTKIMTLYTSLNLIRQYNIDPMKATVEVSSKAGSVIGTRAFVEEGDRLLFHDMMYALMLPSGNDAAVALAEFCGKTIKENTLPPIDPGKKGEPTKSPTPIRLFVKEMNRIAQELGLADTSFANPHGLINFNNKSSARDMAKLSSVAMRDPTFRTVVRCRRYACIAIDKDGKDKKFRWRNTNKLLAKGYNGVKTGITPSAGPCLATSIESDGISLIVVVLNTKTVDQRWVEVKKLTKWAMSRIKKIDELSRSGDPMLEKKKLLQMMAHV